MISSPESEPAIREKRSWVGFVELSQGPASELQDRIAEFCNVLEVRADDLLRDRSGRSFDLLIVEQAALSERFDALLEHFADTPVLVRGAADGADLRAFYTYTPSTSIADVSALVRRALSLSAPEPRTSTPGDPEEMQQILLALSRVVTTTNLATAASIAEVALAGFITADRVHCLFVDHRRGVLRRERDIGHDLLPFTGLAGLAARAGEVLQSTRESNDPRYDPRTDDPEGEPIAHRLVVPAGDRDGTHAVLIAVREQGPVFSTSERELMVRFAERAGPMIRHLYLLIEADADLRSRQEELFRSEPMTARVAAGHRGDIVRVSPEWIRWAYWLLVALTLASTIYLAVGQVDLYSSGPAIIRLHERTEVAAKSSGPLLSVEVSAGQHVETGALLARLDDAGLQAELDRVHREFNTQLRKRMLDPGDATAAQALITLRGQEQGVLARLEEHQLRAPHPGVVSDLRTRAGQHIELGDVVMSLVDDDERPRVIALLPGADRPQIRPGMTLRLEIEGYRYAYQEVTVDEVASEVIGPAEARRFIGPQMSDALTLPGPVVLVVAELPATTFTADGKTYRYYDGMPGTSDIRIRSETILQLLFPALRQLDDDA